MVQRAIILLIQFEIINSAQAKALRYPDPAISMPHSYISLAVCGQAQAPLLFPVCTTNHSHAPSKLQEEQPKPAPCLGTDSPCHTAAPKATSCGSTAPCSLLLEKQLHGSQTRISTVTCITLKLRFKLHSFHQGALLLWWQRILPLMPIGTIFPNHSTAFEPHPSACSPYLAPCPY